MAKVSKSKKRRLRDKKRLSSTPIVLKPELDRTLEAQEPVAFGKKTPIIVNPVAADTEDPNGDENKDAVQGARVLIEKMLKRLKKRRKVARKGGLMNDPNDGVVPEPTMLTETQRFRFEACKKAQRIINEELEFDIQNRAKRIIRLIKENNAKVLANAEPLDEVSRDRLIAYINNAFARQRTGDHENIRKRTRGVLSAGRKLGGKHVFDKGATINNSSRVPATENN
jgi:hypothetical protein